MIWVHLAAFIMFLALALTSVYMAGKKIPSSPWEVALLAGLLSANSFVDMTIAISKQLGGQP